MSREENRRWNQVVAVVIAILCIATVLTVYTLFNGWWAFGTAFVLVMVVAVTSGRA